MEGLLLRELSGGFYKRRYWKGGFGWESVWKGGSFWGCEVGFSQRRKWDVVRWSGSWVQKGFGGYRVSRAGGGLLLLKGGFWAWKCVEEGLVLD